MTQHSPAYSHKGYAEKSIEPTQTGQALCDSTACKTEIPEDALVFLKSLLRQGKIYFKKKIGLMKIFIWKDSYSVTGFFGFCLFA